MVVGHESVPTVVEQPTSFDWPAPPIGETDSSLLLALLGEPLTQVIQQLDSHVLVAAVLEAQHQPGLCVHRRSFHCLANEILHVDGKISGTVVFVVSSSMFLVNVKNELALCLLNFCFARTSTALKKAT